MATIVARSSRSGDQRCRGAFTDWAMGFVVCNFNVDIGPEVEYVYPPSVTFSKADLTAICFNSFPERHDADDNADAYFHFTIKNQSPDIKISSPRSPHGSSTLLFGNCVFRQEYDRQTKRRFNQKSLVLVSHHEFTSLFRHVLHAIVAGDNALSDPDRLEAVIAEMDSWISPGIGQLQLPLFDQVFNLDVPPHSSFPLQGLRTVTEIGQNTFVSAYEPIETWQSLLPYFFSIKELYHTFEHLFLGNSVIVLAKSPQLCSAVVSRLLDLIKPVPWGGLCRPYLTMQSDFFAGTGSESTALPRNFIVGITNPFLLKRIISAALSQKYATPHVVQLKEELDPVSPPIRLPKSLRQKVAHSSPQKIEIPGGLDPIEAGKKYLRADEEFLTHLSNLLQDSSSSQNMTENLVRRHFAELAATLLAPINRYLATHLAVLQQPLSTESKSSSVEYANFNPHQFMKDLSRNGTGIKWRGRGLSAQKSRNIFFKSFIEGPNFFAWMEVKSSLEAEARSGLLNEKA